MDLRLARATLGNTHLINQTVKETLCTNINLTTSNTCYCKKNIHFHILEMFQQIFLCKVCQTKEIGAPSQLLQTSEGLLFYLRRVDRVR